MSAIEIAGIHGFEPRLKASKASVLPLDDIPIYYLVDSFCPKIETSASSRGNSGTKARSIF